MLFPTVKELGGEQGQYLHKVLFAVEEEDGIIAFSYSLKPLFLHPSFYWDLCLRLRLPPLTIAPLNFTDLVNALASLIRIAISMQQEYREEERLFVVEAALWHIFTQLNESGIHFEVVKLYAKIKKELLNTKQPLRRKLFDE